MSEFDIFFDEYENKHNCSPEKYECFEAGQQSQQAKIDAITKQRDSFIKAHHIAMNDVCEHKAKIDELQARINEALIHVVDHGGYDDLTHVINILKGNKDEN